MAHYPYKNCQFCMHAADNSMECVLCDGTDNYDYDGNKIRKELETSLLIASNNIEREKHWLHDRYDAMCYAIDNDEVWMKGQLEAWLNHNPHLFVKDIRTDSRKEHSDMKMPEIKNVKFNDPATIVFWSDGTKTVVKAGPNDIFDPEKGLAMAIVKKVYGNVGRYYNNISKWVDGYYEDEKKKEPSLEEVNDIFATFANIHFGL